jgi:hypothetical protein
MAENPTPITDLHGLAGHVRRHIQALVDARLGGGDISFDFYREWHGGWCVAADIRGKLSGRMDFVLFHTPAGALLALPRPLPERWRLQQGVPASDGSLWTQDDTGALREL